MTKNNLFYLKKIVALTLPIAGVRVIYVAIGFIGMLLIAHLGQKELAAGALVTAISTTLMTIAMSPLLAISMIASRYYGQGSFTDIGAVLRQGCFISIILGLIVCIFLWNLPGLLYKLHQPAELVPFIKAYFHGMILGVIPFLMMASCYQFCFSVQRAYLIVIWTLITLILTVIVGWALIYGYGGLPRLGIAGWSYAGSFVNCIMIIGVFIYFYFHPEFKIFQIFNRKKMMDFSELRTLLRIGWPISIQFSGELLAFALLNIMVGWLGTLALSVQQIILQCSMLALMIPMSGSQACAVLVAQAIGRGDKHEVRVICYMSVAFVLFCMGIFALIYFVFPQRIIALYVNLLQNKNSDLVRLAVLMLGIAAFSQTADAVRNTVIGALRGLHDTWQPMWINITLLLLLALPLAYFLGFPLEKGLLGLNIGFLIAFSVGAVCMLWRFNKKTKIYSLRDPIAVDISSKV